MNRVQARVETVEPGDRIFTPRGDPGGYWVEEVAGPYEDDTFVVLYLRPTWAWENRASRKNVVTFIGARLLGLAPMKRGERIVVERGNLTELERTWWLRRQHDRQLERERGMAQ